MTTQAEIAANNQAIYDRSCADCDGHGFDPDGHSCAPCDGTGRHIWRYVRIHTRPEEEESIDYKVRVECEQQKKWEREDRLAELAQNPELKAKVEVIQRMYAEESATDTQDDQSPARDS